MKYTLFLFTALLTYSSFASNKPTMHSSDCINITNDSTAATWDTEVRAAFMETCTTEAAASFPEGGAKDYCECMLEKIVAKYPNPVDAEALTDEEAVEMATDCME